MKFRCKYCGREFASETALKRHTKDIHKSHYYTPRIVLTIAVALLLVAAGAFLLTRRGLGSPVSGIECQNGEQVTYHVHTLLEIYVRGEKVKIPANIGIIPGRCMYWLHTHDETGLIHIEAPRQMRFTLGQFFDVWGQRLSNDNVLGMDLASSGLAMRIYVDGERYSGDPREIELVDNRSIVLDIGPPFAK
ncbi:MAG: C2H2-type zinc finger protein [Nitrososphaerota archaeon]